MSLVAFGAENTAERQLERERINTHLDGLRDEGLVIPQLPVTPDEFMELYGTAESERLKQSGARVIKVEKRLGDDTTAATNPSTPFIGPASDLSFYYEVMSVPFDPTVDGAVLNNELAVLRPMNPEEVLQYEREAQGISNAQFADGLDAFADGLGGLLSGLGSAGLPVFSAGDVTSALSLDGSSTLEFCEAVLGDNEAASAMLGPAALILGPECMFRVTADRLRILDQLTEQEKAEAREAAAAVFDAVVEVVEVLDDTLTFGIELPENTTIPTAGLYNEVNEIAAHYSYIFSSFPRPPVQHIRRDMIASGQPYVSIGTHYEAISSDLQSIEQQLIGQFGLFGNRQPEPDPMPAEPMTVDRYEVTFDRHTFKRTGMSISGVIEGSNGTRPVMMSQNNENFRQVPGSMLYEPYRESSSVSGFISPELQEQMRAQLADLDSQLDGMPAGQRAQMEAMMGGQMDQMRSMANNGTIEMVMNTTSIEINPALGQTNRGISGGSFVSDELLDMIAPGGQPSAVGGGAGGGQGSNGRLLDTSGMIRMIQVSLDSLGYNPGPANGLLERPTVIAITQFEAAKGMPVTGQATPQLAGILAAEVDAQR
jgi:hypothetical protein